MEKLDLYKWLAEWWLKMLSIRIDKSANIQLDVAALYAEMLPNRIQAAQAAGLQKAKTELKNKLPQLGRPAKYIIVNIEGFGPVGATLRLSPQKSYRSGKHGYDRGAAAAVFISGRRGGKVVRSSSGGAMKIRAQSVAQGYPPYLKKIKLSKLPSHKAEIKKLARDVTIRNIQFGLRSQGFGSKGGRPSKMSVDAPFSMPR